MSKTINLNYIAGAVSDRGATKKINQDKVCLRKKTTEKGEALFAIVCGGMGGMGRGDVAANTVVREFSIWFRYHLEEVLENPKKIMTEWKAMIKELNERIRGYGKQRGIRLGTTLTAFLLLPDGTYYIANVGSNRFYCMEEDDIRLETIGAKEKKQQSLVGTSDFVSPSFANGSVQGSKGFLMCTDGFYHMLFLKKLDQKLLEDDFEKDEDIKKKLEEVTYEMTHHGERDNLSAILIKVC